MSRLHPTRGPLVSRKFASALERVRWAEQDVQQLKELSHLFFSLDVHERIRELDADGTHYVDKIRFTKRMPSTIAKCTVSAIENLRAALDHGTCATVPGNLRKRTSFPFGDTREEFKRHLKSKAKHVPPEIQSLFMRFKAYKRGNPPLWALNKLANTHKHQTIVRPGVDVREVEFVGNDDPDSPLACILRGSRLAWDRRKNEIVISKLPSDATSQYDVDMSLGVAFGRVPGFGGMPVLSVLRYLTRAVERILWLTECEARKIGIVK